MYICSCISIKSRRAGFSDDGGVGPQNKNQGKVCCRIVVFSVLMWNMTQTLPDRYLCRLFGLFFRLCGIKMNVVEDLP